jgi:hypothetical protein
MEVTLGSTNGIVHFLLHCLFELLLTFCHTVKEVDSLKQLYLNKFRYSSAYFGFQMLIVQFIG